MSEPKRCPFCGGEAEINLMLGNYCVTCTGCMGCVFPARGMTREEAIEAWNTRKPVKWIPCSERLPDENDYPEHNHRVLVNCADGIVRIYTIKAILMDRQTTSPEYPYWHVAWMQLPEPYKGGMI